MRAMMRECSENMFCIFCFSGYFHKISQNSVIPIFISWIILSCDFSMKVEYKGGHVARSPATNAVVYHCDLGEQERITKIHVYKGKRDDTGGETIVGFEFITNLRSCGVTGTRSEPGYGVGFASGHQLLSVEAWWGTGRRLRKIQLYFDYNCTSNGTQLNTQWIP